MLLLFSLLLQGILKKDLGLQLEISRREGSNGEEKDLGRPNNSLSVPTGELQGRV